MPLTHPAFASPRYHDEIMASKPVSYYRLREGSGSVLRDEMGAADGAIVGTPTQRMAAGPPGLGGEPGGLRMTNGSGGYATTGTATPPSAAYTLMCWVDVTAVSPDTGLWGRWSNPNGLLIWKPNSTAINGLHQSTTLAGSAQKPGWHHCVQAWDGSTVRFYIDGVLQASSATATPPGVGGTTWAIGSYYVSGSAASRIFTGTVAVPAYWSRAMPAGEIAHFHALGR